MDAVIFPLIKKLRTYEAALRTIHAEYLDSVGEMAVDPNTTLMFALGHLINAYQEVKKTSENAILSITMEVMPSPGVTVSPNAAPVLVGKDVFHGLEKHIGELSVDETGAVEQNEAAQEEIVHSIQDLDITGAESREAAEDNTYVFHGPEKHNGELNEADTEVVKKLQAEVEMLMECLEDLDFTGAESREAEQNNIAVPAERNRDSTIYMSLTTVSK